MLIPGLGPGLAYYYLGLIPSIPLFLVSALDCGLLISLWKAAGQPGLSQPLLGALLHIAFALVVPPFPTPYILCALSSQGSLS